MNIDEKFEKIEYLNYDISKYEKYVKLVSKTNISIVNLNCYIEDFSDISLSNNFVRRLIRTIKKYNSYEVKYIREINKLKEIYSNSIIVITFQGNGLKGYINEVFSYMEDNTSNIYYIVNNDARNFLKEFENYIFWHFTLCPLNENQKIKYIKEIIKSSGYSIKVKSRFTQELKTMDIKRINTKIIDAIIKKTENKENDMILDDKLFLFKKKIKKETSKVKTEELKISSIDKLNNMIGLENVKKQIKRIKNYLEINKNRKNMPALHIVMRGNPGTGKTTAARIIADIFKELEIFKNNNFVEATRETLVGSYIRTYCN